MRWGWLAALVACGGGAEEAADAGATDCSLPSFDGADLACSQVRSAYDQLLDAASGCEVDEDCHVLDSRCDQLPIGACTVGANTCLAQQDLDAVVDACAPDPMSACPEPCPAVVARCEGGRCVATLP